MKRTWFLAIVLAALPALAWALPGAEQPTIGVVRNSQGQATIQRGEQAIPAVVGTHLVAGDTLSTGADGSLGLILRDNSSLSLGPESSIVIQEFQFSPSEGKLALFARLARGTMAYLSGIIGKLSPESVRFETPVASIGIRGTCFAVRAGELQVP
jgi:hypothetical protein